MFLLSGAPRGIEFNSVKEVLLSLKSVKALHSLRLWALTVGQTLVSVHVAIGKTPVLHLHRYSLLKLIQML